jgi:hypothetical protein
MTDGFRDRFAIEGVSVSPTTLLAAQGLSAQQMAGWTVRQRSRTPA